MTTSPQFFLPKLTAYLAQRSTVTVATVNSQGLPQAADVFFAADEDGSLIFVSGVASRHGQSIAAGSRVAVTVHGETWNWREIAGVQMEGRAHLIPPGAGREQAWETFKSKFPFVDEFEAEVARSEFYRFVPEWIRLIDNSVQFGYREELNLRPTEAH
jgi:uncharacterized protein YhbP (UPF0306 family)